MPRQYTGPQFAAMLQRRRSTYMKAEVETATLGVFNDMSSLGGRYWFKGARWKDTADAPNWDGEVVFIRESGGQSIAPEMTGAALNNIGGSYNPVIDGMRRIRLSTAVLTPGVAPSPSDFVEVFDGVITEPEYGGRNTGLIRCAVRDKYALLMAQITDFNYVIGSASGIAIETVLQTILDDHPNVRLGPVTLWLPFGPPMLGGVPVELTTRTLPQGPVLLNMRNIADQIGWTVKPMYDDSTGALRLAFFEADRLKTVADYALTTAQFYDIPSYGVPTDDVRNDVEIGFIDRATGIASSYRVNDPASVLRYGPRYMRIQEDATNNIDTLGEATLMGDAALSDLKAPYANQRALTPYSWITTVGDLIQFPANGVIYDAAKKLAVIEVEHSFEDGVASTTMALRAQVVGAYKNWLQKGGKGQTQATAPVLNLVSAVQVGPLISDVSIKVTTYFGEVAGVVVSSTPGSGGTSWYLCVSGSDSTPRYVPDGTVLGPTDWFYDGTTFAQILNDIPLDPVVTTLLYAQAQGRSSLLYSPWLTIALAGGTTTGGQGGGPTPLGTSVNVIIPVLVTDPADQPSVFSAPIEVNKFSYNPAPFVQVRLDADVDTGGGAGVYAQLQVYTGGVWTDVPGATVDLSAAGMIRGTPIGNPISTEEWFRVVLVGL